MGLNLNNIVVSGRLSCDSETRSTQGGRLVTSFSIFVTYRLSKDQQSGEWQEDGLWMDVEKWEPQNGQPRGYARGQEVAVTGRLKEHRWQGKDGQERRKIVLVADTVREVTKPNVQNGGQQNGGYGSRQSSPAPQSNGYGQPPPYNPPPVNGTYSPVAQYAKQQKQQQAAPQPPKADDSDVPDDMPF